MPPGRHSHTHRAELFTRASDFLFIQQHRDHRARATRNTNQQPQPTTSKTTTNWALDDDASTHVRHGAYCGVLSGPHLYRRCARGRCAQVPPPPRDTACCVCVFSCFGRRVAVLPQSVSRLQRTVLVVEVVIIPCDQRRTRASAPSAKWTGWLGCWCGVVCLCFMLCTYYTYMYINIYKVVLRIYYTHVHTAIYVVSAAFCYT